MKNCRSLAALGMTIASLAGWPLGAQGKVVVRRDDGITELHGLRRWTLAMLNDSLRDRSGLDLNELGPSGAALIARDRLGFADAFAMSFDDRVRRITDGIIAFDETRDSILAFTLDTTVRGPATWEAARAIASRNEEAFKVAAAYALTRGAENRVPPGMWSQWAAIRDAWAFLDSNRTPAAKQQALSVLQGSGNAIDRHIAVGILVNFGNDDAAWTALSRAMLDRDGSARVTALLVLRAFVNEKQAPTTWTAIAPGVHPILDGTNPSLLPGLIALVAQIKPGPQFAKPFLDGGGSMLVSLAGSEIQRIRDPARAVLASLSGKPMTTTADQWARWVASLQ